MDTEDCLSLALSECAIIPSQTVFSEAGFSSLADVKDCVTTASSVNYYFKGPWSLWSQCSCLHQQLGAQLISSSPLQTLVYCYCLNRLPALCNPSRLSQLCALNSYVHLLLQLSVSAGGSQELLQLSVLFLFLPRLSQRSPSCLVSSRPSHR